MNERVQARAGKHMGLAGDDNLVALEDGLIQAGELGVEASKREREMEEEENTAAKRQRYNTMTEIINQSPGASCTHSLVQTRWTVNVLLFEFDSSFMYNLLCQRV